MEGTLDVSASEDATTITEEPPAPEVPAAPEVGRTARAVAWCGRHPLVVAGLIGSVVALANAIWIWQTRKLGGFDPDESSYLSSALRMQRTIDLDHPFAVVTTVVGTGHGITVPVLSIPLLIVGPRDPRTAMMVQPLLLVFIAVATAGITLRITRRALPSVVAATWVVMLPTMTTAVQSYWYGLGAAAAMAGAIWALLSSERASNRYIWWYGVGIGVMCMTRTMTLGYVPAVAAAGLIVAWGDRRAIKRVVAAVVLGGVIAAPWYLANLGATFSYLFAFGYTDRAAEFGETGIAGRLSLRFGRFADGLGENWLVPCAVLLLLYVVVQLARRHRMPRLEVRPFLAIAAVLVLGTVALVSTANNGVWFELPLMVLVVVILVSAATQLPMPAASALGAAVVISAASVMPTALWLQELPRGVQGSHYEWGFAQYDERFRPDRREDHDQAAAEWWALANDVEQELRRISPDGQQKKFLTTGNTHLYNANVVRMAAELDSWDPDIVIPNTTLSREERAKTLGRDLKRRGFEERVLVVGVHDQILWPLDVETRSFLAQAKAAGFVETARFEMPRGGHVAILRQEEEL